MTGFSRGNSRGNCIQVTHFPDNNDIGVMAQSAYQGHVKRIGVFPQLTLGNNRLGVLMLILNRVFNADDIAIFVFIEMADHGGHGGRLTDTRGSCYQDQAPGLQYQVLTD